MHNWGIVTCLILDFMRAGFYSASVDFIRKSRLYILLFLSYCHPIWKNLLILSSKLVDRILTLSRTICKTDLAVRLGFSFYSKMT